MSQVQTISLVDPHSKNSHHAKSHRRDSDNSLNQKKKQRNAKSSRKRSKSFTGGGLGKPKNMRPVLPTRFLLGGNIRDPLNLNSLQDEEINRAMNAVTPKSSPVPTPPRRRAQIEVLIPPNIRDPLNLDCADDAEYEQQLCSPIKKCRKKRIRKKRTSSGTSEVAEAENCEAKTPENNSDSAKIPEVVDVSLPVQPQQEKEKEIVEKPPVKEKSELVLELNKKDGCSSNKGKRKLDEQPIQKDGIKRLKREHFSMNKIVSPVVPQPGAWHNKRHHPHHRGDGNKHHNQNANFQNMPNFKDKNKVFQFGNYNRYYGYRNQHSQVDLRLVCFSHHKELFEGKDILDLGCNIGHITLSVARDFGAKSIIGIDIDKKLVEIARKNIQYYIKSSETPPHTNDDSQRPVTGNREKNSSEFYPLSMPILYGPIEIPGFTKSKPKSQHFPNNVIFKIGNYVLENDSLLDLEQPQFDIILCLSITKWIHLNWGDAGIKQAFRRMFLQLRPGGKLILEPQNWASYKSKKKLTETIYRNFNTIHFFPENFTQYLLSNEVGFAKSEILGYPQHQTRGFQRPIQMFTKSNLSSTERPESGASRDKFEVTEGSQSTASLSVEDKESNVINPAMDEITADAV